MTTKYKIGAKSISVKLPVRKVEFMAGIEFGMLSKGCKNYGICRIQVVNKMALLNTNKKFEKFEAIALVHVTPDQKVEMFFLEKTMDEKIRKLYFGRTNFIIGEDVLISPPKKCKNEQPPIGIIKKGAYPFEKRSWGYWVRF